MFCLKTVVSRVAWVGTQGRGGVIRNGQMEASGRDRVQRPEDEGGARGPVAGWGLGAKSIWHQEPRLPWFIYYKYKSWWLE